MPFSEKLLYPVWKFLPVITVGQAAWAGRAAAVEIPIEIIVAAAI